LQSKPIKKLIATNQRTFEFKLIFIFY